MADSLYVGPRDHDRKRLVVANDADGQEVHRDRFDTDSAFLREKFRERCGGTDSLDQQIVELAEARDREAAQADGAADGMQIAAVCLADVQPEAVSWLWPGRIARGKLTLIVGDPGYGKSFLTIDLAARVTTGARWPDASGHAPTGGVVLLNAEDDIGDTVRPRLDAAGADVAKVTALTGVRNCDERGPYERPLDFARDLLAVERAIEQVHDCRLVVIDPISAYLGRTDSHKDAEVRGLLAPLFALAARRKVAVVAVTHLRKAEGRAVYRGMGSIAFVAAARAAWAVPPDQADTKRRRRLFLPVKNNIAGDVSGLAFELSQRHGVDGVPCLLWHPEAVTTTADEALATQPTQRGRNPKERRQAVEFLSAALADGPRWANDVEEEGCELHDISARTLKRARQDLGVVPYRAVHRGPWILRLPSQSATIPIPVDSGPLSETPEIPDDCDDSDPLECQISEGDELTGPLSNGHDPDAINRLFQEVGEQAE